MSVFAKGKAQSGSKHNHKGVLNKHIGKVLSSAKALGDFRFEIADLGIKKLRDWEIEELRN
jgi:hypothetical protein